MTEISTEVLVIGSGAGGAVTASRLARAGCDVVVVEEGPWLDADDVEPFSLEEMVAKYRHRGLSAALGSPGIAFAEGRCVGGSTEINSGLYRRLPADLAEEWRTAYRISDFDASSLDHFADLVELDVSVTSLPGPAPESSEILARGAAALGWREVEFSRVFRYEQSGRGVKQTMSRTFVPRAVEAGAQIIPDCRVDRLLRDGDRIVGARCTRTAGPAGEQLLIRAEHVFVCAGAIQSPALLQRSGIRSRIGRGLKFHPTVKVAARFTRALDHEEVPVHRVTEFSPYLTIGGSASRRGHVALALADSSADYQDALEHWTDVVVYYAAIRSEGSGRVLAIPGLKAPLVTYSMTDADMSRLTRGVVHLGELLFAAGAVELYPGIAGAGIARDPRDLVAWWDALDRTRGDLLTVHLTSTIRMGEERALTGADSFGRVWGYRNLRVNDAALLPDAPGVNPQAAIMTIATRNAEEFLAVSRG
ncbi:MAG TPA: GMC family oxidoreductase [Acidimicrobiia bacterium]